MPLGETRHNQAIVIAPDNVIRGVTITDAHTPSGGGGRLRGYCMLGDVPIQWLVEQIQPGSTLWRIVGWIRLAEMHTARRVNPSGAHVSIWQPMR